MKKYWLFLSSLLLILFLAIFSYSQAQSNAKVKEFDKNGLCDAFLASCGVCPGANDRGYEINEGIVVGDGCYYRKELMKIAIIDILVLAGFVGGLYAYRRKNKKPKTKKRRE